MGQIKLAVAGNRYICPIPLTYRLSYVYYRQEQTTYRSLIREHVTKMRADPLECRLDSLNVCGVA